MESVHFEAQKMLVVIGKLTVIQFKFIRADFFAMEAEVFESIADQINYSPTQQKSQRCTLSKKYVGLCELKWILKQPQSHIFRLTFISNVPT